MLFVYYHYFSSIVIIVNIYLSVRIRRFYIPSESFKLKEFLTNKKIKFEFKHGSMDSGNIDIISRWNGNQLMF